MTRSQRATVSGIVAGIMVAWVLIIAGLVSILDTTDRTVPVCAEDAYIVGTGQYEAGRWTAYECGGSVDD